MVTEEEARYVFKAMDYRPTEEQWKIHRDRHRVKLICGGERAGKSILAAAELLKHYGEDKEYWLVGLSYEMCRGEWDHLIEFARKMGILDSGKTTKRLDPGEIRLAAGVKVITKSAQDPEKLAMTAPGGVLVCESAKVPYDVFLRLRGRVAEKRGWLVLSGTLEESVGWYAEKYNEWLRDNVDEARSFSLPTWANTIVFPGGREDGEIKSLEATTPGDIFLERYGGIPCPPSGLIMKEFRNSIHVGAYPYDGEQDVQLWVDPGYGGAYAVEAVQIKNDVIYLIDEIYVSGYTTDDVILMVKKKPWIGKVALAVFDIAAKQHQAMPAPVEIWRKEFPGLIIKMNKVEEEAGIDKLRTFLMPHPITKQPQLFVNFPCAGFIAECGGGRSPAHGGGSWQRDTHTAKPLKKNNHACKAVIYGLVEQFGYGKPVASVSTPKSRNYLRGR